MVPYAGPLAPSPSDVVHTERKPAMSLAVQEAPPRPSAPARVRRRKKRFVVFLTAICLLVWLAPMLVARTALLNHALGWLFTGIDGTLSARSASLAWLSPVVLEDVSLSASDGRPAVQVGRVESQKTLLDLVLHPREPGRFRWVDTRFEVLISGKTTNLEAILRPWLFAGKSPSSYGTALELEIDGASAEITDQQSGEKWEVPELSIRLQSPHDGSHVKLGAKVDRLQLTPEMCDRGLQYIVPIVAGVAGAEGLISLELADCRIPTDDPSETELTGTLTVHNAELTGSPLVQSLAAALRLPATARIAERSTITFRMAEGRVEHHGLQVVLGNVTVNFNGSVGLDHTLNLTAEVPLSSGPLRDLADDLRLDQQTLRIPITGTLENPVLDLRALGRGLVETLRSTAQDALENEIHRQLRRLFK